MLRFSSKTLLLPLCLLALSSFVKAQIVGQRYVLITIRTGGDDLRGGQSASADIYFKNRQPWRNLDLNQGESWGNHSTHTYTYEIYSNDILPSDFKSLTIKHNGSPTQAFQDYDNWNIDQIKVEVVTPNKQPRRTILLDVRGQPVVRFTGDYRQISWNFLPVNDPVEPSANTTAGPPPAPSPSSSYTPADVRIVRWKSPVTGDFESMPEGRHTDTQLQSWGYTLKTYQYSAFSRRPSGRNVVAVYRWTMPNCAGSIMFGEHELTDSQLQSWGYKDKEFQFYAYRVPPGDGRQYMAVSRWINAKPQGDPCRDFTLTVAEIEHPDARLIGYGYSEKRIQFYVPRP